MASCVDTVRNTDRTLESDCTGSSSEIASVRTCALSSLVMIGLLPTLGEAQSLSPTPQPEGVPITSEQASEVTPENWAIHGQATSIWMAQPAFRSPYQGPQSLSPAANGRETVDGLLGALEKALSEKPMEQPANEPASQPDVENLKGRVWVTRQGVHIDRIACAWLIRRFIDERATFKFVLPRNYVPAKNELRFDMFDAEFTHEGDNCSFEVLMAHAGLNDAALRSIAEIVHEIDLKDEKFGRDLTSTPFPAMSSTTDILAVASKDKLWVYFQSIPGVPNPRVP